METNVVKIDNSGALVVDQGEHIAEKVFGQVGNTMVIATKMKNGNGKALAVENSNGYAERNTIEILIDNTGEGNDDVTLYLGGPACLAGYPVLFNLAAGAADNGVIKDQYGAGVKFTQGLGLMLNNGAYIRDFQVISDEDDAEQLRQSILVRAYYPNGDTVPVKFPAASTFNMSDQRKNMMKDSKQYFFINNLNGFEYKIVKNFKGSIIFEVFGLDLTSFMNKIN